MVSSYRLVLPVVLNLRQYKSYIRYTLGYTHESDASKYYRTIVWGRTLTTTTSIVGTGWSFEQPSECACEVVDSST